jgi:hypothetical protein
VADNETAVADDANRAAALSVGSAPRRRDACAIPHLADDVAQVVVTSCSQSPEEATFFRLRGAAQLGVALSACCASPPPHTCARSEGRRRTYHEKPGQQRRGQRRRCTCSALLSNKRRGPAASGGSAGLAVHAPQLISMSSCSASPAPTVIEPSPIRANASSDSAGCAQRALIASRILRTRPQIAARTTTISAAKGCKPHGDCSQRAKPCDDSTHRATETSAAWRAKLTSDSSTRDFSAALVGGRCYGCAVVRFGSRGFADWRSLTTDHSGRR